MIKSFFLKSNPLKSLCLALWLGSNLPSLLLGAQEPSLSSFLKTPQGVGPRDIICDLLDMSSFLKLHMTCRGNLLTHRLTSSQVKGHPAWPQIVNTLRHYTLPQVNQSEVITRVVAGVGGPLIGRPFRQGEYFRIDHQENKLHIYYVDVGGNQQSFSIEHYDQLLDDPEPVRKPIHSATYSNDGQLLLVGSDHQIRIWNAQGSKHYCDIDMDDPTTAMVYSPSGDYLCVGDASGLFSAFAVVRKRDSSGDTFTIEIYELGTYKLHKQKITNLRVSPEKNLLITCSEDGQVALLRFQDLNFMRYLNSREPLNAVDFVMGTSYIITSSERHQVVLWSLETCQPIGSYRFSAPVEYAGVFSDFHPHNPRALWLLVVTREGEDQEVVQSFYPWRGAPYHRPWEGSPEYKELWDQGPLPGITYGDLRSLMTYSNLGYESLVKGLYTHLKSNSSS